MIRIAIQSKGRLHDDTMALLAEADIKLSVSKRTLISDSTTFPLQALYLRDDDIPETVSNGVADLGVVGENEFLERGYDAEVVSRLGFGKCRLSLAVPKETSYNGLSWFNGRKIATSYPNILKKFLDEKGVKAEVQVINGSVEISPAIGLADENWCSVHTVLEEKRFWEIIGQLKEKGAQGILVVPIEKMIL